MRMGAVNGLQKRAEFLHVQNTGRRLRGKHMLLLVAPTSLPRARIGFTVSKKVGNAVIRNQVRRRLREISRSSHALFCDQLDYVVIAYRSAADAPFLELEETLRCLLQKVRKKVRQIQ